jgi:rhodanese-related sulfurtransferase
MSAPELCARLVQESLPRLLLLDVRSAEEYAAGCVCTSSLRHFSAWVLSALACVCLRRHVPGAVSAPLESLSASARAGAFGGMDAPLAVVCATGARSAQAAVRLKRVLGFADVTNVKGGTAAWQDLGLPLE